MARSHPPCPWCVADTDGTEAPLNPDTAHLCDTHCAEYLGTSVALLHLERAAVAAEVLEWCGTDRLEARRGP